MAIRSCDKYSFLHFSFEKSNWRFAKKILILGGLFISLCFGGGAMCELIFCMPWLHRLSSQAKLKINKELPSLLRVNLVFIICSCNSFTENEENNNRIAITLTNTCFPYYKKVQVDHRTLKKDNNLLQKSQ